MAKNWKEVRKHLGPEREARIKARVRDQIGRLSLNQLREARSLTQTSLAFAAGTAHGHVRVHSPELCAMGGVLKITAVFPNRTVEISQFQEVEGEKNV